MGKIERNIAQQAVRAGESIPDKILNAPILDSGLDVYLRAFFDLDTERSHAIGLTPIPFTSILKYIEFYKFDEEMAHDLIFLIRKMDNAYLDKLEKKHKSNKK